MKREDPRVIRTREVIEDAFMNLLQEKDFDDITIQDILNKSRVNRSTFYKHYLNKTQLATKIIDTFKQELFFPLLKKRFSMPLNEFSQFVHPIIEKQLPNIRLLWQIETKQINLKRDMFEGLRQGYIAKQKDINCVAEEADLLFQGYFFAQISILTFEYILKHNAMPDPFFMQKNVKTVLEQFIFE